jgi:hypothetical protein
MKEKSTQKIGVNIYQVLSRADSFDSTRYGHVYCDFFIYDDDNPDHTSFYPDNGVLNIKKLQISCQMDNHTNKSSFSDSFRTYAWALEYVAHGVNLNYAKEIVKVLTMINRKLTKYNEEFGPPLSYIDYCQRIFKAVGVSAFRVQRNSDGGWNTYSRMSSVRHEIEGMFCRIQQTLYEGGAA